MGRLRSKAAAVLGNCPYKAANFHNEISECNAAAAHTYRYGCCCCLFIIKLELIHAAAAPLRVSQVKSIRTEIIKTPTGRNPGRESNGRKFVWVSRGMLMLCVSACNSWTAARAPRAVCVILKMVPQKQLSAMRTISDCVFIEIFTAADARSGSCCCFVEMRTSFFLLIIQHGSRTDREST
jgi:hypothetical protein